MNIRKRVLFRLVLHLPGNATSPGYLHKAQRAEDWEEKRGLIVDAATNKAHITTITCFHQQPALFCWSSTDFGLDMEAYKD